MIGRLKFDIQPLVREMLDQLPESVWQSESTTFFDPAMGGGQFVAEIERRLRAYGHSEANISQRVFGAEKSNLRLNYVLQKHILSGKYAIGSIDLDTEEIFSVKKFDIVVGNPPYQKEGQGAASLFDSFLEKASQLAKERVLFITPTSWVKSPTYTKLRKKIIPYMSYVRFLGPKDWQETEIKIDTLAFVLDKNMPEQCQVVLKNGESFLMALKEDSKLVDGGSEFLTKFILENETTQKVEFKGTKNPSYTKYQSLSNKEFTNSVRILKYLSVNGNQYGYVDKSEIQSFKDTDKWRVVIGYMRTNVIGLVPADGTVITGSNKYIPFKTEKEATKFYNYLHTNLVQTIVYYTYTSRTADNPQFAFIPVVDLPDEVTNETIYNLFGVPYNKRHYFETLTKSQF